MDGNEQKLRNCYARCLQLALENEIRSLVRKLLTQLDLCKYDEHFILIAGILLYCNRCLW